MKILHTVEFYEPTKGGAEEVIKQISERLVSRGHEVTVATSYHPGRQNSVINGVNVLGFRISGNRVKGIRGETEKFLSFLKSSKFDVIFNYAAQTWTTDLTFSVIDSLEAKKVIAPLGYSKLKDPRYEEYFNLLPSYLRKYDKILYTSPNYQDKIFGDLHNLNSNSVIVPNGADEKEFQKSPIGFKKKYGINNKYLFISISNHYFGKGHNFIIDAVKNVENHDFTLVIIGNRPQAHWWYSCYPLCKLKSIIDSRIKAVSDVPREYVVSAYREADLFLFGSRVECAPLVMYESFASDLPFITRDVGNVKDHKENIYLVSKSGEMTDEINKFIQNPAIYRDRAHRTNSMFLERYTWDRIVAEYENIYKSL
jgi:L-malate glycosyltransferase